MDLSRLRQLRCRRKGAADAPLTFPDILSDPLVRLLMKADRVDPKALELRTLGHRGVAAGAEPKRSTRTAVC